MLNLSQLEANRQEALKPYMQTQDDRTQRYFDCQDDTLIGGISWQITSAKINAINHFYNLAKEQVENGYVSYEFRQTRIFDADGNYIPTKIVHTKFGHSYVTDNGVFIGCAKKQSTFNSKGYTIKTFDVTLKCIYSGKQRRDYNCIYEYRPVFDNIEEILTEVQFDGNHHEGFSWIK